MSDNSNSGAIVPIRIRFDPEYPKADEEFAVFVQLNKPVDRETTILFEKQRFKFIPVAGNTPELRPTGANYFSTDPEPIKIPRGAQEGKTRVKVKSDALDADTGDPVAFPDDLVFTWYIATTLGGDGYAVAVVRINPAM